MESIYEFLIVWGLPLVVFGAFIWYAVLAKLKMRTRFPLVMVVWSLIVSFMNPAALGVGLMIAAFGWLKLRSAASRRTEIIDLASSHGFSYIEDKAQIEMLLGNARPFVQHKLKEAENFIRYDHNFCTILIFNYSYRSGASARPIYDFHSAAYFKYAEEWLPSFNLHPKIKPSVFIRRLKESFAPTGHGAIADKRQTFADIYNLEGESPDDLRGLFDQKLSSYFERNPGIRLTGEGDEMIMTIGSGGKPTPIDRLASFIKQSKEIAQWMRPRISEKYPD